MKTEFYLYCLSTFAIVTFASETTSKDNALADEGIDPRGLFYENDNSESVSAAKSSSSYLNYADNFYNPQIYRPQYIPSYYPPRFSSQPPPQFPIQFLPQFYQPNYLGNYQNLEVAQESSAASSASKNQYTKYLNTGFGDYYPYNSGGSSFLSSASQSAASNYEDNFSQIFNSNLYPQYYPHSYPYNPWNTALSSNCGAYIPCKPMLYSKQ